MLEALYENIQEHLSMLDLAIYSSKKIRNLAQQEDVEGVAIETENRARIVNIVAQIQRKVEDRINMIQPSELSADGIMILKAWFHDLNILSEKMIELDKETVELLSQQKEDTTKEIAMIFKNKEIFKSYNHEGKK